jgi:predicted nucleic acid-binding protein
MRVVLDTNILVRAGAKSKGPAKELLRLIVNSPDTYGNQIERR